MKKQKILTGEQKLILSSLPKATLKGLHRLTTDTELYEALRVLLTVCMNYEREKIVKGAAAVTSLDTMINNSVDLSFHRGRLSMPVLLNGVLQFVPQQLDQIEQKGEGAEESGK